MYLYLGIVSIFTICQQVKGFTAINGAEFQNHTEMFHSMDKMESNEKSPVNIKPIYNISYFLGEDWDKLLRQDSTRKMQLDFNIPTQSYSFDFDKKNESHDQKSFTFSPTIMIYIILAIFAKVVITVGLRYICRRYVWKQNREDTMNII